MSDAVMHAYVAQTAQAQRVPQVTLAWQGGEPTLMGLDFCRRARDAEADGVPPGMAVERTPQTNGVLLDDEWCAFLAENDYLVGLSIDGPREVHDAYRHDAGGRPVFDRVLAAARRLQRHRVEFNVLCTVNAANAGRPLEVYRFFRGDLGARFIQLIPIVEVETPRSWSGAWGAAAHAEDASATPTPGTVSSRSVRPADYECPKNRLLVTPDGEPGLNWLCAGLKDFFTHTDGRMRRMAAILQRGGEAREVMDLLAAEARATGRNDPCPCGSGAKYKRCCGLAAG
jgi:sulfatase maturation enzyme AslB (radical SAM superfamily)